MGWIYPSNASLNRLGCRPSPVECTCRVQMLVHSLWGESVVRLWCACTLSSCAGKGVKSGMHKISL
jgi:hypothetical protein